jgi:hypothetical protein
VWDALVELCLAAGDSEEEWLPVQAKDIVSKLYTNTPPERLWMAEVRQRDVLLGSLEQRDVVGDRAIQILPLCCLMSALFSVLRVESGGRIRSGGS